MVNKRYLQLALALLTAVIVASAGVLFVMHHALMMSAQPMTHVMSGARDCVSSLPCNKICDVAQTIVAPISEKVFHQLVSLPTNGVVISLAVILSLMMLAYLEPLLKRPPKLYLEYCVLRF